VRQEFGNLVEGIILFLASSVVARSTWALSRGERGGSTKSSSPSSAQAVSNVALISEPPPICTARTGNPKGPKASRSTRSLRGSDALVGGQHVLAADDVAGRDAHPAEARQQSLIPGGVEHEAAVLFVDEGVECRSL
jgi:hypothetical protein